MSDADEIANLINAHELSVDPANSVMSSDGALEFMNGYIDSSVTHLLSIDGEIHFNVVVNLHPDEVRGCYFADVYAKPEVKNLDEATDWAIKLAQSQNPHWKIWPGVNDLDTRLKSAWANQGFEFLRRYHTMRKHIATVESVRIIDGVEIKVLDISEPDAIISLHKAHQDSFSHHFGFVPRDFDNWRTLTLGDSFLDEKGIFVALMDGEVVGFSQCTDEYAHDGKGFVSLIGVIHRAQGHGIGEALLQTSIIHSAKKGYKTVELNVDTGNESGALRLYEKLGFTAESAWIQMHHPAIR